MKLQKAVGLLRLLLESCAQLREQVLSWQDPCQAAGFLDLRTQVERFLSDDHLQEIGDLVSMLASLAEGAGLVLGARIGPGGKGTGYVLRRIGAGDDGREEAKRTRTGRSRIMDGQPAGYGRNTLRIPLDSLSLSACAVQMEDAVLTEPLRMANRLSESLQRFFSDLRFELAFLVGACRLAHEVQSTGMPLCFPEPVSGQEESQPGQYGACPGGLSAVDLVDVSLGLRDGCCPTPNGLDASSATLILVTGANQGGKSTFLRSVGLAQLMAQCGLFTTARVYRTRVFDGLYTHFAREEDPSLRQGRLEEELVRMERLLPLLTSQSLLLMNESFATTTEREGARIAEGVILALAHSGVTLVYVTHLLECASTLYARHLPGTLFLRAERAADGSRPFRLMPGKPLATSHAMDLYEEVMRDGDPVSNRRSGRDV